MIAPGRCRVTWHLNRGRLVIFCWAAGGGLEVLHEDAFHPWGLVHETVFDLFVKLQHLLIHALAEYSLLAFSRLKALEL